MFSNTKPEPLWLWLMSPGGVMDIDINDFEFIGFTSEGKRRYKRKVKETTFKVPHRDINTLDLNARNYEAVPYVRKYATQSDWIPGFVDQYAITDIGEIVRTPHKTAREASVGKLDLRVTENKLGAPAVDLKYVPHYIAVLVLRTFCRYENRYEIPFHKDGNRWNYCLDNLEWRHYQKTDAAHCKAYAVMWKKDEDNVNYKPDPFAGKVFKEGVVVEETRVEVDITPQTIVVKRLPKRDYIGRIAIGKGKSISGSNKPKTLPPPKAANETVDEPDVEFIPKQDWDNGDIKDITPDVG